MRRPSSTFYGLAFNLSIVESVWRKGQIIFGYDPNEFRKDSCGAWIRRADYGNTSSQFGWEIDHIQPVSKYGSDDLFNLQPLQWQNNRSKSDNYPNFSCFMRAAY